MFTLRILPPLFALSLTWSGISFGQQSPAAPANPRAQDLPVIMAQSVLAGKTAVGTKVQAKLELATLMEGKLVPRNAMLSGEVVESIAKTATAPSRLSIRMDSVQWKDGTAPLKVYLTAWYYPTTSEEGQNLQYGPTQSPNKTWNGQGAYPNPNSPSYKPFPGSEDKGDKTSVPDTALTKLSNRRVLMKNVEMMRADDGTLMLFSGHGNIKLDKLTTYIFATSDSLPAK